MKTRVLHKTLLITALCIIVSCSDNSTSADDSEQGSASFSLSGDLQGSRSGGALFPPVDATLYWDLFIFNLGSDGGFTLEIRVFPDTDTPGPPPRGTYTIGAADDGSTNAIADYVEFSAGPLPLDYTTFFGGGYGGSITITESGTDEVRGTFQFTAGRWDDLTESFTGEINITNGNFTAKRERF